MVDLVVYIYIMIITIVGLILGYILSGRARIYLDIGSILFLAYMANIFSLFLYETNQALANLGFIAGGILVFIMGVRVRYAYTQPIKKMTHQIDKMNEAKDFSDSFSLQFTGGYDVLRTHFEKLSQTITYLTTIIENYTSYERQTENIVGAIQRLNTRLETDIDRLNNDINENLQSAVMGNEISEKLQTMVQDLSVELNNYNHKLAKAINATDVLSDQTNLVAVNAAIEAAHSEEAGVKFALVADGIQRLSSRSRDTASSLARINTQLNKMVVDKINALSLEFSNLDDVVFKIADLSDGVSSISHEQQNLYKDLNNQMQILQNLKIDLDELRQTYKI